MANVKKVVVSKTPKKTVEKPKVKKEEKKKVMPKKTIAKKEGVKQVKKETKKIIAKKPVKKVAPALKPKAKIAVRKIVKKEETAKKIEQVEPDEIIEIPKSKMAERLVAIKQEIESETGNEKEDGSGENVQIIRRSVTSIEIKKDRSKELVMWGGVCSVMLIVFCFWLFNIQSILNSEAAPVESQNNIDVKKISQDLSNNFSEMKTELEKTKKNIKEMQTNVPERNDLFRDSSSTISTTTLTEVLISASSSTAEADSSATTSEIEKLKQELENKAPQLE